MVFVTSRQVAPFQALLNMIKINYMDMSEVFQTLIAILCDYDPANVNTISKTCRYIRVLLTRNPDLAECLITFLPQPITQPDVDPYPILQPSGDCSIIPLTVTDMPMPREVALNYHIRPDFEDIKPVIPPKEVPYSWYSPIVEESIHKHESITASVRDVKMVNPEYCYDETSPHPRPLMVPSPGGVTDHYHVVPTAEPEVLPIKLELGSLNQNSLQFPGSSSEFPTNHQSPHIVSQVERSVLDLSMKSRKSNVDQIMKPNEVGLPAHPLLKQTTPGVINKSQTMPSGINNGMHTPSLLLNGLPSHMTSVASNAESFSVPVTSQAYTLTHYQDNGLGPANTPTTIGRHPPNAPLGLYLPLPKLLKQEIRPLSASNPALSRLLSMTKVPSTFHELHKSNPSGVVDDQPCYTQKVPRLTATNIGHELESLKELTNKLKVAEQTLKKSQQYAKVIPPLPSPVRFKIAGIPFQLTDRKQQYMDPGSTRNLTSFPYLQRVILPDGDVRTLNIGSCAGKEEMTIYQDNQPGGHTIVDGGDSVNGQPKKRKIKLKKVKRKVKPFSERI